MAVAANAEVLDVQPNVTEGRPVDLVHLARYTLGNRTLEQEILQLFCRQSAHYLELLKKAEPGAAWRDAAHTIKGSAKGVGAWQVAGKAEAIESLDETITQDVRTAAIASLERSISEAKSFIEDLLKDA